MSTKLHFLIIDPQEDFMDKPGSALPVSGAVADTIRLAECIKRLGSRIDDISLTLDSHRLLHIAHPIMWLDNKNQHPNPFTSITLADVKKGMFRAYNPGHQVIFENYLEKLEAAGRRNHFLWPPHCLISTPGHNVAAELRPALLEWETKEFAAVDYVTKGSAWNCEHFGVLQAEVPDPNDPTTGLNIKLLETLQQADIIAVAGQALSHCIRTSLEDLYSNFGDENIKKIVLLRDATSPVTGFEADSEKFVQDMVKKGMQVSTCAEFLS